MYRDTGIYNQLYQHKQGQWHCGFEVDGDFHKWGTPIAGWFIMENHGKSIYKWMIWGYTYFRKPPYTTEQLWWSAAFDCPFQTFPVSSHRSAA